MTTSIGDSTLLETDEEINTKPASTRSNILKKHKRAHRQRGNLHAEHVPSDEMDLLIETINTSNLGWTADICKLQKHHHMYDADKCEGTQLAQTSEPDPTTSEDMIRLAAEMEEAEKAASGETDKTDVKKT